MEVVSPWDNAFNREPLRKETRDFDLPNGKKLTLTLEQMDPLQELAAVDRYQGYVERYIDGTDVLMSPFGERLEVSQQMLGAAATLEGMQRTEKGVKPYTLIDWMGFAQRLSPVWRQITQFADSFTERTDDGKGNSPTGGQETDEPAGTPSTP